MTHLFDIAIIGAGPVGLSMALHAKQAGLHPVILDKGTVVRHLLDFPIGMSFFTPTHSLELSGIPLDCGKQHATREEIISYYTRIARLAELDVRDDRCFERLEGTDGAFVAVTRTGNGDIERFHCKKLVVATGVFGQPRRLQDLPGSTLPKVSYLYREPYIYAGKQVVLVGAGNSSAGAAIALHHAGAHVTVLDRNSSIPAAKWRWHLADLADLVSSGDIRVLHQAVLERIDPQSVTLTVAGERRQLDNDAVIVLLGYEPNVALLDGLGIAVDPVTKAPSFDPCTLETSSPGVYVCGIVCAGTAPDKIFVWGARNHPSVILRHILGQPPLEGVRDLGVETIAHWAQFEKLETELDLELALRMVPVVTGEMRDDFFDIYEHATGKTNLYAETAALDAPPATGPLVHALDGWLLQKSPDGSVIFKGQRLSQDAFEIVALCDGTRTLQTIVEDVARQYEQPFEEVRDLVMKLVLSLLRGGRLTWRVPSPHRRS